jgi:nitrate reductase NapE component
MDGSPHLPVSTPHVEKLADFLVLRFPIFPLASLGTIRGGLAYIAVLELEIRRLYGATNDTALGHD